MAGRYNKRSKVQSTKPADGTTMSSALSAQASSWASNVAGGLTNAIGTGLSTFAGYKAGGPWGAAMGLALGSTITESVKSFVGGGVSAWQARRAAAKEGGGIGAVNSILSVRQTATAIVSKIEEGSSVLAQAMDKVADAIGNIDLATDGSTSYLVNEIKLQANQVLEAATEAQNLAGASKGQISAWMGKI